MSGIFLEVLGRDAGSVAAWDRYVTAHPAGTIYHLSAWRTIFEKSFNYRSWLLMARDDASGAVTGVLPLYLVSAPFSRRLVSVPFRDRGGPLWNTSRAFDALVAEARSIAATLNAKSVRFKTTCPYPKTLVDNNSMREHVHWVHSAIDLKGITADTLWDQIGDKNRNMVRQAQRHRLLCEKLSLNEEALRKWHDLHLATQKRLGIPPFPITFFMCMFQELTKANGIAVFGVRQGERPLASTLLLLHGTTAIYGYSASVGDGQRYRANDLMLFEVIRWLVDGGFQCLDLGSDSPKQHSLLFFKRKWLAAQSPIPVYGFDGDQSVILDSSSRAFALARKSFALLPTAMAHAAGRTITKYFG